MSSSRFDLCDHSRDHLSEERVERNPALCELLNEDVGFFVSLNLRIKFCVSCPFTFTCFVVALFTCLLSLSCSGSIVA
jgi:hypothetical protein